MTLPSCQHVRTSTADDQEIPEVSHRLMNRIADAQKKDAEISPVYHLIFQSAHKLSYNEIAHWGPAAKAWWAQWDQLNMNDDVLCRVLTMVTTDQRVSK